MFGSVSQLARIGVSLYTKGRPNLVSGTTILWRSRLVCPLFSIINSAGSLASYIIELCVWLDSIYENNPLGLEIVWLGMAAAMEKSYDGSAPSDHLTITCSHCQKL
jgi:hypothetical protein